MIEGLTVFAFVFAAAALVAALLWGSVLNRAINEHTKRLEWDRERHAKLFNEQQQKIRALCEYLGVHYQYTRNPFSIEED